VRLLLDTHVLLWWSVGDRRLRAGVRGRIARADAVFVSSASVWEIAIKKALGRIRTEVGLEQIVEGSGFSELPILIRHAAAVESLPAHHTDPFDRMLVAQAVVEGLVLVTHDRRFEPYGATFLWT
jgi:PIN domain nuclease of toxin-antitoxin system